MYLALPFPCLPVFFPPLFYLLMGVAQRTLVQSTPSFHHTRTELKLSFSAASVCPLSHLAGWGVAFLAFPTLELQLQISHVSESSLNYHGLPPSDFQRHLLPLYCRGKHSRNGQKSICVFTAIATHPRIRTESRVLPMPSKCSIN